MKKLTIDNTAAAGATCALLLIQSVPGLHLTFSGIPPFGWQLLLGGVLSVAMFGSALLIIFTRGVGWLLAFLAELVVLIWIASGAVAHPVLFRDHDFVLLGIEALTVICLASARLLAVRRRHVAP